MTTKERQTLKTLACRLADLADRLAPQNEQTIGTRPICKADASAILWDLRDEVRTLVEEDAR